MIESMTNSQIKHVQKLIKQSRARKKEQTFVVEGWKMVSEALARDLVLHLYVKESEQNTFQKRLQEYNDNISCHGVQVDFVSAPVFDHLSDTVTPQGILATVKMPCYSRDTVLEGKAGGVYTDTKLIVLEDIQDPGNIGTIVRTAEGAGMSGVVLSKGCVDLFNPKVVRSTMGALFRVPFYVCDDIASEIQKLKRDHFSFYAAHLQGTRNYCEVRYEGKLGILIGNEANGVSDCVSELADKKVKIPMEGQLESLNAAVSAALFAYEVRRCCR